MFEKYEYKCISITGDDQDISIVLTEYGAKGWKLVCVYMEKHYLRKSITEVY